MARVMLAFVTACAPDACAVVRVQVVRTVGIAEIGSPGRSRNLEQAIESLWFTTGKTSTYRQYYAQQYARGGAV